MILVRPTSDICQVAYSNRHEMFLADGYVIAMGSGPKLFTVETSGGYLAVIYTTDLSHIERTANSGNTGWVSDALETVEGLESFTRDWNGLDSDPPSPLATTVARNLIDRCRSLDFAPNRISASAEGGVAVC